MVNIKYFIYEGAIWEAKCTNHDFLDWGLLFTSKLKSSKWWSWDHPFENFTEAISSWLTVKEYLFHRWRLICSYFRNNDHVLYSSNETYRIRLFLLVLTLLEQQNDCQVRSPLVLLKRNSSCTWFSIILVFFFVLLNL